MKKILRIALCLMICLCISPLNTLAAGQGLSVSDFVFTPPTSLAYDGTEKQFSVTPNDNVYIDVSAITVKYAKIKESDGTVIETPTITTGYPIDAGTYQLYIDVAETDSYNSATNLTDNSWTFTITPIPLTVSNVNVDKKYYGDTDYTADFIDGLLVTGLANADYVTVSGYGTYTSTTVLGTQTVELTYTLSGSYAGNYCISDDSQKTATGEVIVDTSEWGEEIEDPATGITQYVSVDGTTSAMIFSNKTVWVKESSSGKSSWFALNDTNQSIPSGSRFSVMWLDKTADQGAYDTHMNNLDATSKNQLKDGYTILFDTIACKPDSSPLTLTQSVDLYVQLPSNWDDGKLYAYYITSGTDEAIDVTVKKDVSFPDGTDNFAVLKLNHFSPYILYFVPNEVPESDTPATTPPAQVNPPASDGGAGGQNALPSTETPPTDASPTTGDGMNIFVLSIFMMGCAGMIFYFLNTRRYSDN